ncbi:SDR family NAD(P)-dependent oxidoreductase [Paraburkholderia sp. J63]|uniref:SDR family NAD(P)-dependent oxidoreductase n=1 Tax=Paraburkholderia sp. J63 TaxID=2805434 RepID=UPI002ABD6794|nr:SDR family NAD(P)-dependent oxidoreductase [Paraburkholderia sp. J63]
MNAESIKTHPRDWMVHSRINGLTALVVGAGSGMGEASAKAFAANGGAVVVADLRAGEAERVAAEIASQGGQAISVGLDVSKQADIDAAIDRTIRKFGKLDVVINTAALVRPAMLEDVSLDQWRAGFQVNVDGALMVARSALPWLKESPHAAIVNTASLAGVHGYSQGGAYGPSKAALITLSRQMAHEWAAYGVRVNVVLPGVIDTPMARGSVPQELLDQLATMLPMSRVGQPEEVADLIVYLASPAAGYITAQAIACDGGMSHMMFAKPMGK